MENRDKHIDDLFRQGLNGHTETPPPAVWKSLDKRLGGHGGLGVHKLPSSWLWYAIGIITLAVLGYFLVKNKPKANTVKKMNHSALLIRNEAGTKPLKTDTFQRIRVAAIAKINSMHSTHVYNSSGREKHSDKHLQHNKKAVRLRNNVHHHSNTKHVGHVAVSKHHNAQNSLHEKLAPPVVTITPAQRSAKSSSALRKTAAIKLAITPSAHTAHIATGHKLHKKAKGSTIPVLSADTQPNSSLAAKKIAREMLSPESQAKTGYKKDRRLKTTIAQQKISAPVLHSLTSHNAALPGQRKRPEAKRVGKQHVKNSTAVDTGHYTANTSTKLNKRNRPQRTAKHIAVRSRPRKQDALLPVTNNAALKSLDTAKNEVHTPQAASAPSGTILASRPTHTEKLHKRDKKKNILAHTGSSVAAVKNLHTHTPGIVSKNKRRISKPVSLVNERPAPITSAIEKVGKKNIGKKAGKTQGPIGPLSTNSKKKEPRISTRSKKKKMQPSHNSAQSLAAAKSRKEILKTGSGSSLKATQSIDPIAANSRKKSLSVNAADEPGPVVVNPIAASYKKKSLTIKPAAPGKPKPIDPVAAKSRKKKPLTVTPAKAQPAKAIVALPAPGNSERKGDMAVNMTVKKHNRNYTSVPALQNKTAQPKEDILAVKTPLDPSAEYVPPARPPIVDREKVPDYLKQKTDDAAGGGASSGDGDNPGADLSATGKKKTNRFEFGIKMGYEAGLANITANKSLIAPFLQYNLSSRLALVFQPGIKFAKLNNADLGKAAIGYYNIAYDSMTHTSHLEDSLNPLDTTITDKYRYKEKYDSLYARKRVTSSTYVEVELPILMQYKVSKDLSVLGGIDMMYGQIFGTQSQSYAAGTILLDTTVTYLGHHATTPVPTPINTLFTHTGSPYSTFVAGSTKPYYQLRFGYMFGFSYSLWNRFLIDVMVQQNITNITNLPDPSLKSAYMQPYFRIMVGYKLFRSKMSE